jgi:ubiquinone/menaquinone biosynthesis C-methylase UbiE
MSQASTAACESATDPRIAFFDHHAPNWDSNLESQLRTLQRLEELCLRLNPQSGQNWLEIGCGTGQVTAWLSAKLEPGTVTAVDFSPGMLAQARAKGIRADFECWDITRRAPPVAQFDTALCFHSFPHFSDPVAALKNIAIGLKPGGKVLVVHLAGSEQINAFHRHHAGGAVAADFLPQNHEWPTLLKAASFRLAALEDRPDLFWLEAFQDAEA